MFDDTNGERLNAIKREERKLRLLTCVECNLSCPGCCNDDWDIDNLPVCTDFSKYDLIMLTGGEPMLFPAELMKLIQRIRENSDAKIILYTAKLHDVQSLHFIMKGLDGITVTLHEPEDVPWFYFFAGFIHGEIESMSLRVNVFHNVSLNKIPPGWKVKRDIHWIKDCPLPEGEEFMKIERFLS
jgi:hypothetical protein